MSHETIKTIIYSGESKFDLIGNDNRVFTWRKPCTDLSPKNILVHLYFKEGSVIMWVYFSYYGVVKLVFIDGITNFVAYVNIFAKSLHLLVEQMGIETFTFQQDNDPKYTSRLVKNYFIKKSNCFLGHHNLQI